MVDQITQLLDDIDRQSVEARRYPESAQFEGLLEHTGQLAQAVRAVLAKCASMERGVGYRVSGQHDTWDSYHEGMSDMAGYIEEAITDALGDDDE